MPASNAVPNCVSSSRSGGAKPESAKAVGRFNAESQALVRVSPGHISETPIP
jgi:hypothetical protein